MRLGLDLTEGNPDLLDAIAGRSGDPTPGLRVLADALRARQRRVFATSGASAGATWARVASATASRKGAGSTLVDSGVLRRSLTQRGAKYAVEKVTGDTLVVGTKNPVANLLRGGTVRMPARHPVPPVTAAERTALGASLLTFLVDGR